MGKRSHGPSSGMIRRSALRPRRLTATQLRLLVALDERPRTVEDAAQAAGISVRSAYLAAAALLEAGRVCQRDGLLHPRAGR